MEKIVYRLFIAVLYMHDSLSYLIIYLTKKEIMENSVVLFGLLSLACMVISNFMFYKRKNNNDAVNIVFITGFSFGFAAYFDPLSAIFAAVSTCAIMLSKDKVYKRFSVAHYVFLITHFMIIHI
jgi:lysylphosphatidylglycerol synthetase-like protein (DUF2156 family)